MHALIAAARAALPFLPSPQRGLLEHALAAHDAGHTWADRLCDRNTGEIIGRRRVKVAAKPLALLLVLAAQPGNTVPWGEIIAALWTRRELPADPRNCIHHAAGALRRALAAAGAPAVIARRLPGGLRLDIIPIGADRPVVRPRGRRCAGVSSPDLAGVT